MDQMHEGDSVFHKPTQSRCIIMNLYNGKATIRTEENMVIECDVFDLTTELDTLNVF